MDHRTFLKLFLPCENRLKGYFLAVTHNMTESEDLLQEVSTVLWEHFERYDSNRPFHPWALSYARLEALKWRQKQARNKLVLSEEAINALAATAADQGDDRQEEKTFLAQCLGHLSEHIQNVIRLKYVELATIVEIAARTAKSESAVEVTLVRARRALRQCVERKLAAGDRALNPE